MILVHRLGKRIAADRLSRLSMAVVIIWIVIAFLPLLVPQWSDAPIELPMTRVPPHFDPMYPLGWLGYDSVGTSVFLQVVNGAGVSLVVGCATVIGTLLMGVPLGAVAGFYGGRVELLVGRTMDILLAFPPLVLPLTIAVFFGGGLPTVVLALCAGGWIGPAKIVRAQFKVLKSSEFVLAATALGANPMRIIFRHIMPSTFSSLIVHATFTMSGAILSEAGLSFLGLGVADGHVSWGGLLSEARAYLIESPHMAIFPSLAMLSLVVSLNFLGETLRISLDPRQSNLVQGD